MLSFFVFNDLFFYKQGKRMRNTVFFIVMAHVALTQIISSFSTKHHSFLKISKSLVLSFCLII